MLWVILWLGGLGALDLVGREMLLVEVVLLRAVGGRAEVVCMMWWRRVRVMIMVCRRSNCTSTTLDVTSFLNDFSMLDVFWA
jgi:hypothetical protein